MGSDCSCRKSSARRRARVDAPTKRLTLAAVLTGRLGRQCDPLRSRLLGEIENVHRLAQQHATIAAKHHDLLIGRRQCLFERRQQIGFGHDAIRDFVAGAQSEDVIDLTDHSGANDFGDIVATQVGSDTLIDLGADSITLLGVSASDLHTDDFIF